MPTRSRLLLLRFSFCATISIVVAAASDANAGAQANVDIGLHLHGITPSCRTRFVGSRPTNENVSMILFGSNKNKKWDQEGLFFTASFNHDEVGITKPTISDNPFPSCLGYQTRTKKTSSYHREFGNDNDTTTLTGHTTVDGWRVLRYQKRVGYGKRCYRRVRTALFHWDFEARVGSKSMGIVSSTLPLENDVDIRLKNKASTTMKNLLATFTELRFPKPLKSIFVVNPVHVVYEVMDAPGARNSLFSSAAYATLSGHLLAGEERVTVRKCSNNEVEVEIVSFSRSTRSILGKCIWSLIGRMQQQFFLSELWHLDKIAKC
ncbi:hypothetical protein ACHAXH_001106 [Discostella pseudostelligera]